MYAVVAITHQARKRKAAAAVIKHHDNHQAAWRKRKISSESTAEAASILSGRRSETACRNHEIAAKWRGGSKRHQKRSRKIIRRSEKAVNIISMQRQMPSAAAET